MAEINDVAIRVIHEHIGNEEALESVKVERNTKGFNFEVKAPSVERVLEMVDQLARELSDRLSRVEGV